MISKEDILEKNYELVFGSPKYKDSVNRKMNQEYMLPAMDEYAKKIAIGFAEWAFGDEINPFVKHGDRYIQACGNSTSWPLEQLFQSYLNQLHQNI